MYPFAGFLPTTCALPNGNLPSKKVTVPPVADFVLVVTAAVRVTFSLTFTGLGATASVIALTDAGADVGNVAWATAAGDRILEKTNPTSSTTGNLNRHNSRLTFIFYLGKGM